MEKNALALLPKAFKLALLHLQLSFRKVSYGSRLRGNSCIIKNVGKIELGDNVSLNSFPDGELFKTGLLTHTKTSSIKIGNNCLLNGAVIHSNDSISIGDNCMFGPGVVILDNDSHNTSIDPLVRRNDKIATSPVVIGNNVWVGMHSIIMKGVEIGDNSIVAAGSIVTKSIPSNVVYGGNPALLIKKLEH